MSHEQVGIYWWLVSLAWLSTPTGTLPNDDKMLAEMARLTPEGWLKHRSTILAPFDLNQTINRWEHSRLVYERDKQLKWLKICKKRGKFGYLGAKSGIKGKAFGKLGGRPKKPPLKGYHRGDIKPPLNPPSPSPFPSPSVLTSKDNGSVAVATPSSVGITTTPKKETTPIQKIILAFKQLQGVSLEDKAWDHTYFSRFAKPAKDLLGYFDGDWKAAVDCEQSVGEKMQRLGRTWTIETVIKFAHEYKAELLKNGRN